MDYIQDVAYVLSQILLLLGLAIVVLLFFIGLLVIGYGAVYLVQVANYNRKKRNANLQRIVEPSEVHDRPLAGTAVEHRSNGHDRDGSTDR